jgi:hypothetical protein
MMVSLLDPLTPAEVKVRDGKWQLRRERFIDGKHLKHWGLINMVTIL